MKKIIIFALLVYTCSILPSPLSSPLEGEGRIEPIPNSMGSEPSLLSSPIKGEDKIEPIPNSMGSEPSLLSSPLEGEGRVRGQEQPSGKEILEKIDENLVAKNRISTSIMVIKGRRGKRTVKAKSWSQGIDKAFTEYLSPAREKGTKMLKLGDELWIWSPSTDRIIKIAGHMLRQSLMGSDVSYEDFMEDPKLTNVYDAEVTGEEKTDDRLCYVLELKAKKEKVSYYSRKIWVDKERYLPLREDRFAKSGKLLKTTRITEVFKIGKRWYPKRIIFKDVLKKGKGTEFVIESIKFNVKIPKHIFSKASLRR